MVNRFDVFLINLDAETSDDPKNTRPAVVISPDELNRNVEHAIVAPISSTKALFPTRVPLNFLNSERHVILDQIRSVEKGRLVKKIGEIDKATKTAILEKLQELFSE